MVRRTDHPDMIIVVERDVKHENLLLYMLFRII